MNLGEGAGLGSGEGGDSVSDTAPHSGVVPGPVPADMLSSPCMRMASSLPTGASVWTPNGATGICARIGGGRGSSSESFGGSLLSFAACSSGGAALGIPGRETTQAAG